MPDKNGYFGKFGGRFVPEPLVKPLKVLEDAYLSLRTDTAFLSQLNTLYRKYAGRPSPLYLAKNLSRKANGRNSISSGKT
jgi:tryptophan synthase beta chain